MHSLTTLLQRATTGSRLSPIAGLESLPWVLRFSLADVFAQARYGEQVALSCAQRLWAIETDPEARAFALTQVRDEARHLAFFDAVQLQLGVDRPVLEPLKRMFDVASAQHDLANVLLGTHVIVETLAHDLFAEVARALSAIAKSRWLPKRWRQPCGELGRAMLSILRDESRHVAFGVLRLAELRDSLSPSERDQLDDQARRWVNELERTLHAVPVLFALKSTKRTLMRSVLTKCRQRCRDAGLEVAS